jgi:hypothetical protein
MNQIAFDITTRNGVVSVTVYSLADVPAPALAELVSRYGPPSVEFGGTFSIMHDNVAHAVVLPPRQVRVPTSLPVSQSFPHSTYPDGLADSAASAWAAEISQRINQSFSGMHAASLRTPRPDGMITAPLLRSGTLPTDQGLPQDLWFSE